MLAITRFFIAAVIVTPACTASHGTPTSASVPESAAKDIPPADAPPVSDEAPASAAATPMPAEQRAILDTINDKYDKDTDPSQWTARFEKEGREVRDRQVDILGALAIEAGTTVADVGAGTGLYTMPFAEAVGADGHVFAVDVQAYFLDHIQQRASKAGHEHVTPIKATSQSVGLPANSVDLVFMCDAFHHIEQPVPYLASMREALKNGGRLVIIDYRRGPEGTWRYGHIRATPAQFLAEFEAAGFHLEREVDLLEDNFFYVLSKA